ncbi:SUMF1/EgtB/PvdO family nonheme iron enzyme [Planctomicrobium piriforme]|uniref:Formylglycine-generating enzyme, required for sulfatase activity, contains SUMF1/FGE domain n=1 Tax=Planctomicrobium piriforme TaxID=1576369 RepID=A0A1I3RQ11_9PLAN|nr:SUMF1/EgtB/PvdO family nonheme iron enzyme [Planctomicrobium piriforme]SFJ48358.1 Formylglycine-generating enzyme, required for sulfatase activity, contains SUMF1/FGE domain [Planctomicrobium piriforme]
MTMRHSHHRQCIAASRNPSGLTLLEVLFVLALLGFVAALLTPLLLEWRERSRQQTCRQRLQALTLGLERYHDVFRSLPPAAVWNPNAIATPLLHRSRQIERITHQNWAQLLLPFIGESNLAAKVSAELPVGHPGNALLRTTAAPFIACPTDAFNRSGNRYQLQGDPREAPLEFARGNFAINGGTHHYKVEPPSTSSPQGDFVHLVTLDSPRQFQLWGNGIAGINRSFSFGEFSNGRATLIALEELRAGIHPLDPRGVWALGQIGGSISWAHGVNGDAAGPNNAHPRSDDVLSCGELHAVLGSDVLQQAGMPCVSYIDHNQQATARSQHPGGVHVACLDGSVRFVSNAIDSSVWHILHSRETPPECLADFNEWEPSHIQLPSPRKTLNAASVRNAPTAASSSPETNSIGMSFVLIPAGRFTMGLPDAGNNGPIPAECPPHPVEITQSFWLSQFEVTRDDYQQVLGRESLPALPEEMEISVANSEDLGRLPVTNVSWDQAAAFCQALSNHPEELSAGSSYRLPTEAEWEYACRDGSTTPFRWSPDRDDRDDSGAAAGVSPPLPLTPVGSDRPSSWGLYDMRGNAWEWTADWYQRDAYLLPEQIDPQGPRSGHLKVIRGSDWRFVGEACRIDTAVLPPWKTNPIVGFRVIRQQRLNRSPPPQFSLNGPMTNDH